MQVPGIGRYVQNHNVASLTDAPPEFDGFSECWFEDRAAFDLCMASEEWDTMNGDAFNLFVVNEFIVDGHSAILDEVVIVPGTCSEVPPDHGWSISPVCSALARALADLLTR